MLVRPARPSDAQRIGDLHADSWRRHYRGAYSDEYLDGDVVSERRAVWEQRLTSPTREAATVIAEDDAKLIGFVHVVFDADPQWGALIDNLHVVSARKRSGVGRRLMADAAAAVIARSGRAGLYLWVLEQNAAAQAFYTSLGGRCVERALTEPPGGDPARLTGAPGKLRYVWDDAGELLPEL